MLKTHMSRDARAFWTVAPGRGEIRDETLPAAAPQEVVVRTLFSGVSRGTESLVFHGRVPAEEYQRMRAPFQAGDFPAPMKYGYANVGRVESGPAELAGRTVFCLFPHQTAYVVPAAAVRVVPEHVPAGRAVLAANMETALNGVWDAHVLPGDRVTVVGGGTVGCLVAWLAGRVPGCDVQLVDVAADRAGIAQQLGVRFALAADAGHDRDVVIHASGAPAGLDVALSLAGFEATVVELSWYGDQPVTAALGKGFHAQRLTLKSSQVGHVPAERRARWSYDRRMATALALLAEPALDALITSECPFDELPGVMARLASGASRTLCHRVRYPAAGDEPA